MSSAPVIVITGASSGIGRATALRLAARHARLVLVSRRQHELDALAEECADRGAEAIGVAADVADAGALPRVVEAAVARFGRIDAWLNGAAVTAYGNFEEIPIAEFQRVMDVNVMGYAHGMHAVLPTMLAQGRGTIVNIASILAETPQPFGAPYSMSKAAVRGLSASLRSELWLRGERKVRVVTILPPTIDTPIFQHAANHTGRRIIAMPPVYPPELVVRAIEAALKHPRRPERVVGLIGRRLVAQHRRRPELVERQIAVQTGVSQLSPTAQAAETPGTVFTAQADPGVVRGGWHGRSALARRVGATVATGFLAAALARKWYRRA